MNNANEKLIKNIENQVERLMRQLRDLEEFKDDLTPEEFESMKEETADQIKEFTATLDRMNKGDVTINNKHSVMKQAIRDAIAKSFNTVEMIKMFGAQNANVLEQKLLDLDQEYRLKRITMPEMENQKIEILNKLAEHGHSISSEDQKFLERHCQQEFQRMEEIVDE